MSDRQRLPNRRGNITFSFQGHQGQGNYIATVGYFGPEILSADLSAVRGRMAELFLACDRPNSTADVLAKDASLVLSIALQHGVPVQALHEAVSRLPDGSPAGPLGRVLDEVMGGPPSHTVTPGLDPEGLHL